MRNSSLVEYLSADNVTGLNTLPKLWILISVRMVEERSVSLRSRTEKFDGGIRSENAGMSNEKMGEIPIRRKPKVSWVKVVFPGLVGP